MAKFNRSKFMKSKWETANNRVKTYEQLTKSKVNDKRKFISDNNPLDNSIVTYQVSTQMNYQSCNGGLIILPKTFIVTAFRDHNTENNISNRTKQSLSSMKMNGNSFNTRLQIAIENNAEVDISQVRGMEETKKNLTNEDYNKLLSGQYIVESNDDLTISKSKGGQKYNAKQDLSEFL